MQSLSTNIANIVDKSLAQETNYVTSCNNLRTFINTLVSDSTDFQTSINNKATDVATKATAFDGAITAEPTLFFKNENDIKDKALVMSIIRQESRFDQRGKSPARAQGLMQILPSTAAFITVSYTHLRAHET